MTGAPSSSGIGASIESVMCWTMWMLSSSMPYPPIPVAVIANTSSSPSANAKVRPIGHASPRRRSRITPAP